MVTAADKRLKTERLAQKEYDDDDDEEEEDPAQWVIFIDIPQPPTREHYSGEDQQPNAIKPS